MRRVPLDRADETLCIGIEQQLVGIEPVAVCRLIGAMHPVGVDGSRLRVRQIAVPDLVGELRKFDAFEFGLPGLVKQAQLDPVGVC
jgi:hypothetical protein